MCIGADGEHRTLGGDGREIREVFLDVSLAVSVGVEVGAGVDLDRRARVLGDLSDRVVSLRVFVLFPVRRVPVLPTWAVPVCPRTLLRPTRP